ncbi:MAG: Asp-tRNA(Asn)/Glu-tRNA(Gln) amidotransferase subunit GatB, partial [Nanoarchaeota archaeon]
MKGEVVIGLEVHVELNTATKLFCSCSTQGDETLEKQSFSGHKKSNKFFSEPNTRTCPVCLGHPGSKPVVNKKAIEHAIKLAIALNCKISKQVIFSRKNYFYPDLAKNYQITQYEVPIGSNGYIEVAGKKINLKRIHIEEDPASMIHPGGIAKANYVLVDYNRSGNPLVEIVTEPDMISPEEAREFLKTLITLLQYLNVFDPSKNIMKADANISIKKTGYKRAEIKNITGFREIEKALQYEIKRQNHEGIKSQETRAWDAEKGITQLLRKKETDEDYGYIFDPDLVPIDITPDMIKQLKKEIPELPCEKYKRYVKEYKLSNDDALILSGEFSLTQIFEKAVKKVDAVLAAKWIRMELMRVLNYNNIDVSDMKINHEQFVMFLFMLEKKKITDATAQKILERLVVEDIDVESYVKKQKLGTVSDINVIEKYCKESIAENPQAVEDYKSGKEIALNFILGSVMRKSGGKADPKKVKD